MRQRRGLVSIQNGTPGMPWLPVNANPRQKRSLGAANSARHRGKAVTSTDNKKARYRLSSGLFNACKAYLVGPAGVEPTTNGLKVRCSTN